MDIAAKFDERPVSAPPMYDLIELFFFAYRDFVGDADRLLITYEFGRAHHRVLHFVSRQPGLTIAELLEILKITKQSLNRVLKELIDKSFIEARAGAQDRRHRQLHVTPKGARLARELAQLQTRRFMEAMDTLGEGGRKRASAFLLAMIDENQRERVVALIGAKDPAAGESYALAGQQNGDKD
ncbi:MarR family winged helix-turn-helix transcriptional regulator [Methylocapsa sp. S129]|uniref:MarR family winged helix-turn-helix transcriptional regulator n=1 Tax=Methylocapsa sp. S129 TaxID=1641869 RepID=UPI00131DA2F4|nr:MarR family transcriptional regulator [Methylocapsa sp. S129]